MLYLARVSTLLFNTPLLASPDAACTIAAMLSDRWNVDPAELGTLSLEASRFVGKPGGPPDANGVVKSMYRVEDGVALISVHGELVNRGAWIGASSGLTSYEGLDAQLEAAGRDPAVRGVILDVNSPGGQASGAMETAAKIRALDARKPVVSFINGTAASAAYALASGARTIVATPSAVLGSIGVVWMHVDRSAQASKAGVKPTILTAGAYKADGHSVAPLDPGARARIQAQIDKVYALFVDTVAAHRPMTAAAVRATEAGVFIGSQAVAAGLADRVGSLEDSFKALRDPPRIVKSNHPRSVAVGANDGDPSVRAPVADATTIYAARAAAGHGATGSHLAFRNAGAGDDAPAALAVAPRGKCDAAAIYAARAATARGATASPSVISTNFTPDKVIAIMDAEPRGKCDPASIYAARAAACRALPSRESLGGSDDGSPKAIDPEKIYALRAGQRGGG